MKKLTILAAAAATAAFAQPALATTNFAGTADVIGLHDSDPGLVVYATPIGFGPFSLEVGQFNFFDALTIGTTEGYINGLPGGLVGEDEVSYSITVGFIFTDPTGATGSPITGETHGVFRLAELFGDGGYGEVTWDDSTVFSFGDGGSFSVKLYDTVFDAGGSATVKGKIKLLSEPSPTPEPATWGMMLAGFGALGLAMRRRRNVKVSFA